jgi:hypothetical protein
MVNMQTRYCHSRFGTRYGKNAVSAPKAPFLANINVTFSDFVGFAGLGAIVPLYRVF